MRTVPVIDAHQHVWDLSRADYPWLGEDRAPINRTVPFEEVQPQLAAAGVPATVLVQAADNAEDTALMLECAELHREVVAVVAYAPLDRPEALGERLAGFAADPVVVGVRTLIHDQPDPDWLLRTEVQEGLGLLERSGLSFDVVAVLPRHLEIVLLLSERFPELRMVIDHLGEPPFGAPRAHPWWSLLAVAAENPRVTAKVSGLYPHARGVAATEAIRPHFEHALEHFGPDRLMYGSDWPISVLAGGYAATFATLEPLFTALPAAERSAVLGGTAARFYGIDPGRLAAASASRPDSGALARG